MLDNFTANMLERAGGNTPHRSGAVVDEWFTERGLDLDTVTEFARAFVNKDRDVPVTETTLVTVGIMFGIELGKLMCDPSYKLAREMTE